MTKLREWRGHFLPGALRSFFSMFHIPPLSQSARLEASIAIFARHFHHDNPQLTIDAIQIMAYAIVLLSVDLSCNKNQIRNKMSKREVRLFMLLDSTETTPTDIKSQFYLQICEIGHWKLGK